jgi:hypothetical protein
MNKNIILFLAIFILISCKSKRLSNCAIPYTMENLFRKKDSSRFNIQKEGKWTRVYDKGDSDNKNNDRGFYSFDENNILRSY